MVALQELGQRAAGYQAGGLNIAVAAAQVLNEALGQEELTYADLYQMVQTYGTLYGYSVYLVPWGTTGDGRQYFVELKEVVKNLSSGNFMMLITCARLLIRIELIRVRLRGKVDAVATPNDCIAQELAGYITLREVALFCARSYKSMPGMLQHFIERGETTYEVLHTELYAAVQTSTLSSAVFRPAPPGRKTSGTPWRAARSPTGHSSEYALRFYHLHVEHWDDRDRFMPKAMRTADRHKRRPGFLGSIGWLWGGRQ